MKDNLRMHPLTISLGLFLCSTILVSCHNKAEEDPPVKMADTISLIGAGATFPYPIYSKWFDEYRKQHPTCQINYQSIGSGGGIKQFTEGTVDFGASDGPMNDEQLAAFQRRKMRRRSALPDGPRRGCSFLQRRRRHGRIEFHAAGSRRDLSWARSPNGTIPNLRKRIPASSYPRRTSW